MAKIGLCILLSIGLAALSTGSARAAPSPGAALADTSRLLMPWADPDGGWRSGGNSLLGWRRLPEFSQSRQLTGSKFALPAGAAEPGTPAANPDLWGADGNVLDIARSGNTLYIAGSFRSVGENSGGFVAVDSTTGGLIRTFPKVAGSVSIMIPDGAGGWYMGGEFSGVGGRPRSCLAQVRADGTVTDWNPSVTGSPGYIDPPRVSALARYGDRVFVGGAFQEINGQPRANLGCVDAMTGELLEWDWHTGNIYAMALRDSILFAAGEFSSFGGQPRAKLAALNTATGEVLPWRADVYGSAYTILLHEDTLFVGGSFLGIAGVEQHMLAALNARTGELLPFNARVGGVVRDYLAPPLVAGLDLVGDTLYVAGNFTSIGGVTQSSIAAVNATTGDALAWIPPPVGPQYEDFPPRLCETVAVSGGALYIGGWFETLGGESRPFLAAVDRGTGGLLPWNPKPDLAVDLIVPHGDTVYIGGLFSLMGEWRHRAGLAAIDLTTGAVKSWNPNPNGGICTAVTVKGDRVFVSGDFTSIGGDPQPRQNLAALDTLNGEVLDWNPGANSLADMFLLEGDTLYAVGYFTEVGGQPRNYVAAIDATTGEVTAWNPDADSWVLTMARSGSTIFLGGIFQRVGGQRRPCLAAVDAHTGAALPWDSQVVPGVVDALLVSGNTLYVGGGFEQIGGQPRSSLAALDATTGEATPWYPEASGWGSPTRVRALALVDSVLYVGGSFATMGGQPRICLAAVDTSTALAMAWNPGLDGLVWTMGTEGKELFVGGGFTRAGGLPAVGLAAFTIPDAPAPRPLAFALTSIPNPARADAVIRFTLPQAAQVCLSVFDLQGRRVARLLEEAFREAGRYDIPLQARGLKPGVYLCRLDAGGRSATRKMVFMK